jgi:CHC2 zinc finger
MSGRALLEWDVAHGVGDAPAFWLLVRFDAEHEWDRLQHGWALERTQQERKQRRRAARARLLPPPPPGRLTTLEALERLERVRKTAKGWSACCPAHEDATPSLLVSESDARPGEPVFHCFAGCHWQAVRDALRREAA